MLLQHLITTLLTLTLSIITVIHIYWFCGGEKGLDAALPNDIEAMKKRFSKPILLFLNGLLLFPVIVVLIFLILSLYSVLPFLAPYEQSIYFWFSIIFIARALFGWLLFNKLTSKELFIKQNARLYSPIFLFLGISFLIRYALY